MKKLILSTLAMASLAFAASAETYYMNVKTDVGKVVKYDVENVSEVYYEETFESTTDQGVTVSGKEGFYTYVDLGLPSGTKWATHNVGATMPTEYGNYFAWGETKPKEDYSWNSYKWCTVDSTEWCDTNTKYNTDSESGIVDNKVVLEAEDDAASANWGSAWRMPTEEEMNELLEGCVWEWVEDFNGSVENGLLGTSKANGATIFLPAAGYRKESSLDFVGRYCLYWSSSLLKNYWAPEDILEYESYHPYYFEYDGLDPQLFDGMDDFIWWMLYRRDGLSIRAVLK